MGRTASREGAATLVLDDPRGRIAGSEERLAKLNASLAAAQQRQLELRGERETLVRAARLDGNAAAQKRLYAIDEELAHLACDLSDDRALAENLSEELAAAERARIALDWEERREKVRGILASRLEGRTPAKVLKAAKDLAEALRTAEAEDREAYEALRRLDEGRTRSWKPVAVAHCDLARFATAELRNVLSVDTRGIQVGRISRIDIGEGYRRVYKEAVEQLDRLELVF